MTLKYHQGDAGDEQLHVESANGVNGKSGHALAVKPDRLYLLVQSLLGQHQQAGPVALQQVVILERHSVLSHFEALIHQAASNLAAIPIIRKCRDIFYDWSEQAMPGWVLNMNGMPLLICVAAEKQGEPSIWHATEYSVIRPEQEQAASASKLALS